MLFRLSKSGQSEAADGMSTLFPFQYKRQYQTSYNITIF